MYQLEIADKIIRRAARKFSPSFRGYKDFEDLVQDGHIEALVLERKGELKDNWEARLTTWIRSFWLNELKSLKVQKRDRGKVIRIDDENFNPNLLKTDPSRLIEACAFLSNELKTLALLFLNTPQELIDLVQIHNNREGVRIYLKKKGWNEEQLLEWKVLWEEAEIS